MTSRTCGRTLTSTKTSCPPVDPVERVLGLDPGSRVTGWGLLVGSRRRVESVQFGCLTPRRSESRAARLASLSDGLDEVLRLCEPGVVVVETPFTAKFPRSALALAESRGALLAVLGRWGGKVVEYEPARVKAAVVGNGRAEKRQVCYVVQRLLELPTPPQEDAADALALAVCHLWSHRLDGLVSSC